MTRNRNGRGGRVETVQYVNTPADYIVSASMAVTALLFAWYTIYHTGKFGGVKAPTDIKFMGEFVLQTAKPFMLKFFGAAAFGLLLTMSAWWLVKHEHRKSGKRILVNGIWPIAFGTVFLIAMNSAV